MKINLLTLALLLCAAFSSSLSAQWEPSTPGRGCGISMKSGWLKKYQAGEIAPVPKSLNSRFVPMRLVLVGDNGGAGYLDPVTVLSGLEQLNEDFTSASIQFYISSIDYLDNSRLFEHNTTGTGSTLARAFSQSGVMNTFFVSFAGGACGYAIPESNYLVMQNDCSGNGDRTWSHEAGHVFSLAHTFYGWEAIEEISSIDLNNPSPTSIRFQGETVFVEKMDGSNCNEAADGFCDTEPDYLMERWSCNGNAEYRDSLLDPDSVRFAVTGVNFMSYANDLCQATFTPEQQTAMFTSLARNRNILEREDDADNVAALGTDVNLRFPENNATTDFSNEVDLTWDGVPNADYYVVQVNSNDNFGGAVLNSFFTTDTTVTLTEGLVGNRRYFWRVRPVNSFYPAGEFGEQIWRFRTGRNPVSSIDPALNAAISVAPNPVSGGRELRISGRDLNLSGRLAYELMDPAGRVLRQRTFDVSAAGFTERLETTDLPAGIYFLRLRLEGKLVTRRIVVTP